MNLIIKVDTGTDTQDRYILNPLFILLAESWFEQGKKIAGDFCIGKVAQ